MTKIETIELVWGQPPTGSERKYFFGFDPVMGLSDVNGQQIGIDGWTYLAAPDDRTTAHLKVDHGITLEQLARAISRLEDEGGFRSVAVSFEIPDTAQ